MSERYEAAIDNYLARSVIADFGVSD